MAPRVTVVVPTRERADTLLWCLKTCVSQDYEDLEIIVSDNASTDDTREVVDSFDDERLRYVNPGRRLGMSDHWEFVLEHVADGHVGFVGDDDGVMPGGVATAADVLREQPSAALIWPLAAYYWPRYPDQALANHVSLRVRPGSRVRRADSRDALAEVAAFRAPHYVLPSLYWGFVHTDAIKRARSRSGEFFRSMTPDLYSGAAIAAVTDDYLHIDRILTLSGTSHHSNGASQVAGEPTTGEASPRTMFLDENTHPFHREIAYSGSIPVLLAEVLLQARDEVDDSVPTPDLIALTRAALSHDELLFNPASAAEIHDSLRATAASHGMLPEVDALIERSGHTSAARTGWAGLRNVLAGNPIHRCPPGVSNIYEATLYADRLLSTSERRVGAALVNARGRATKLRAATRVARTRFG